MATFESNILIIIYLFTGVVISSKFSVLFRRWDEDDEIGHRNTCQLKRSFFKQFYAVLEVFFS